MLQLVHWLDQSSCQASAFPEDSYCTLTRLPEKVRPVYIGAGMGAVKGV